MKKLLKIEALLIAVYLLIIIAAALALFYFRVNDRLAMPVFIGLFSIAPFVIFFPSANRISPRVCKIFLIVFALTAILFFIPALKFSICLPIPLLIVFMLIIRRERRIGFENWLKKNRFSPVQTAPDDILETLGRDKNWQCFANSFFLASGREVPYLIWFGYMKTNVTTYANNTPIHTTALVPQLAFSFFPQTVSEKFKQAVESSDAKNQSFWQNLKPNSQMEHPFQTARMPDETFVAAWSILHVPTLLDEKLADLKLLLENT